MELVGQVVLKPDIKNLALVRSVPNIFIGNKLESFPKAKEFAMPDLSASKV
jgi:hypothetical protein